MAKKKLTDRQIGTIDNFINGFVAEEKRARARKLLLGGYEQRIAALQKLPEWLVEGVRVEDNAATLSELIVRFGKLQGSLVDEIEITEITIDSVCALAMGGFGALFISDNGAVAVLFPEIGRPTLCVRTTAGSPGRPDRRSGDRGAPET